MKFDQVPIDEDTFHQIYGNDNYKEFIKNNPSFCYDSSKILKQEEYEGENNLEKKKMHSCVSIEDFKIFMMLTWLELYLPRYEFKYGYFEYSTAQLSNQEKINELLDYYASCGVTDIEQIRKNSFKGFRN